MKTRVSFAGILACAAFFILAFSFQPSLAFSDELILEIDPDEQSLSPLLEYLPEEQKSFYESSFDALRQGYVFGYQELFQVSRLKSEGVETVLNPLQKDLSLLESQIQNLEAQMETLEKQQLFAKQQQAELLSLSQKMAIQLELVRLEVQDVKIKFENLLGAFLRLRLQSIGEDSQIHIFQLFSSASQPSEVLFQMYLADQVQDQLTLVLQDLLNQQLNMELVSRQVQQSEQQLALTVEQLISRSASLQQQQEYQRELFSYRLEEEEFFESLLSTAREEQDVILARIRDLSQGTSFVLGDQLQEAFAWPVSPLLGISAEFQDPDYRSRFGLDHNAVDIPTEQLTPVQAPLSGRVVTVHDGGERGYSYLQLVHRGGYSTVYGHLFSFRVEEGDLVQRGQVVGLSGGAIGTRGAGRLTTGPHLHFEVLRDGEHIDPRTVLPSL